MKIRKLILGYYAVLFVAFGILGLVMPSMVSTLIHYDISSSGATMEFMATYGGLFLGVGGFMFYCIKSNIQAGLVCVLLTMGAMLISRVIGFGLYGGADYIQYIYLAGELFTVVLVGLMLAKPINTVTPDLAVS
jgi:hypothetical protein